MIALIYEDHVVGPLFGEPPLTKERAAVIFAANPGVLEIQQFEKLNSPPVKRFARDEVDAKEIA